MKGKKKKSYFNQFVSIYRLHPTALNPRKVLS